MLPPEEVVRRLRESGSLWDVAPGVTGLSGRVAALEREIEQALADIARAETPNEWRSPAGVSFETLERAKYFSSFPQWLSMASHLSGDDSILQSIASSESPGRAAPSCAGAPAIALSPAVCYNTYAALADSTIDEALLMTAQGTCWRHEGERHAALERGWAFTMREIVCVGTAWDVKSLLDRGVERASALAARLGLETEIVVASDPFFAPSARGRPRSSASRDSSTSWCSGSPTGVRWRSRRSTTTRSSLATPSRSRWPADNQHRAVASHSGSSGGCSRCS